MYWRSVLFIISVFALVACSPSTVSVEQDADAPSIEEFTSLGRPQFLNSYADW